MHDADEVGGMKVARTLLDDSPCVSGTGYIRELELSASEFPCSGFGQSVSIVADGPISGELEGQLQPDDELTEQQLRSGYLTRWERSALLGTSLYSQPCAVTDLPLKSDQKSEQAAEGPMLAASRVPYVHTDRLKATAFAAIRPNCQEELHVSIVADVPISGKSEPMSSREHMIRLHERIGTWNMQPKHKLPYATKQESRWDMLTQRVVAHLTAITVLNSEQLLQEDGEPDHVPVPAEPEQSSLRSVIQESSWDVHCQAWLAAHTACDDLAQQRAAAHRAVCERLCREEKAHDITTDDTSAVKSYNETEAISWMKAELDEQLIIHEVGVVKAARIIAESSPDTVKKCGCDCVVPTVCGCGCIQDVSVAADDNLSGDSEANADLTEGEPERASQKSEGRAAPQSDQGKPAPSVSSVTDRAVAAAAQRVAAYSAANTEFVLGVMEARQPRATVSRPTCSRGKRDAIQRSRPGGRRRKHFMQRGLSLMLRDNLFAATLKALRNVDWSSIVCTLTMLTAITVMLLSGCLAVEAEDMPKQQVYQGAVLLAAEDWMGSYVCSTMYQFCAATVSLVGCMMKLNTWHMWRMLFGWVKTQGSRIKFWLLFGWLVAANANYWSKVLSEGAAA